MPNLVSEDDIVLLQFLDDHDMFDGCEHDDMSQMMQGEAPIMEYEFLEVSHGNRTQHNLTTIPEEVNIDQCIENEFQISYSCSSSVVSIEQWMPYPLERNFVNDFVDQSATSRSYNEQQTLHRLESRDYLVSCHCLISPSSSSMVRMHSLAGNPLPQATTSSRAPPPSTLCPHALKHKFPEKYGGMEPDEEFLKRCLRHTSLDMLISRPVNVKIHREHSLAGYPLDGAYLDIPLGNSIYCFEEIERIKTNNNV